jgi:formylglycine-generating enzyme required for sulfatase activity/tRNA A-37 threonylcarbamoyl transferase component Bud32
VLPPALPTEAGLSSAATATAATADEVVPVAVAGPALSFLAPPQAAGEVGWLGGFRVLRVLGAGGMGVVLEAEDVVMRRRVALKVMRPEVAAQPQARERFLREARAAGNLSHDHVLTVHQVGQENGVPFLVMPLLQGETLETRLQREPRLPLAEAARIAAEMAAGLAAAHAAGLIHRDVKPANVWLEEPKGRVKLLDFGLARQEEAGTRLTQTGGILGTPAYLAPEQAGGQAEARTDVFSLGCVLYEMIAGRRPFDGPNLIAIIARVTLHEPPPLNELRPEVPAGLSELVRRMLAKSPAQRPTAVKVAEALRRSRPARGPRPPSGVGPTVVVPPPIPRPRRRWGIPALVTVSLVLVVVAAVLLWPKPRGETPSPEGPPAKDTAARGNGPKDPPPVKDRETSKGRPPVAPLPPQLTVAGIELTLVHPGRFLMGSPDGIGEEDEKPQHEVQISRPFYLGVYPVTQAEYFRVTGQKPGRFAKAGNERFPIEGVSWEDAVAFCEKLSALPAEKAAGRVYRLPTEAEWEYACRAGTKTAYSFGDDHFKLVDHAWVWRNASGTPRAVGQKKPNAWGLHDMHGNVWEWCHDWYGKDYYRQGVNKDPRGPENGQIHVLRGGSCYNDDEFCRAAFRNIHYPDLYLHYKGFRVACSLPQRGG